jgi:hypothetical protein
MGSIGFMGGNNDQDKANRGDQIFLDRTHGYFDLHQEKA